MLKTVIMRTSLYQPARRLHQAMFNPGHASHQARMGAFYSQFFQPGDRVFDVGANQGEYSEIFANEGARVVAIEPNTAWTTRLSALARSNAIEPVFKAVSDEPGEMALNVCSESGYSTLADTHSPWIEESPDYANVEWTHALKVPVTTMDLLAAEFGVPEFVKIDVEGFEINVLRGMSFRPRYLSFEFGARRKEPSQVCLDRMGALDYRFRPILGREYRFATPEWMTLAEATAWLADYKVEQAEYGDMFCHRA